MMKNLMHRIKAPTVLLMLLFLFLGGVISVKAEATSFGTGSSWEIDGSVLYININNTGDFTTYINDWQGGNYGATLITAMNGAVTKVVVKTLGSATLNSNDAEAFYFTGDGGNITTIDFSEAVFDSHAFEQLETDQIRDGSVIYNLIVPDADKLNPSTAMGGTAYNLFGKNGDELIAVINNYSKLVWSDVKGSCTTLVINQDITSDLDLSTSGFSTFIFNGTLSAYVTLPDGKTAKINDESQGIYIKSDNEETGTGITFVFPKAKEGIFGTGSSAYLLSKDGKTLTLNIKATGDLASIKAATDWEAMSVAETVNVEMDGGSLNAADINKLMSSFPSATTINLANATISEDVTISNSTVTTLNLTGIDATGHNITISGCNYIAKVNLSKAKAETITVTGWTGLIEVNVTSATFTSLVVNGTSSTDKVKVVGTVDSKVSGSNYEMYDGEPFGTGSKYMFGAGDETVVITLAKAGDLADLATKSVNFSNTRFVKFITNSKVIMSDVDFLNMNLFGTSKSVTLDFTDAEVDDDARAAAVLNSNGVVIGTAQKLEPQATYSLYGTEAQKRINAMINIADYKGTNNSVEIYAEAGAVHTPTDAGLKVLNDKLLEFYPSITDVHIIGAAFNDAASSDWLKLVCKSFEYEQIKSFRVSEYTLHGGDEVALENKYVTDVDFAYLWDNTSGTNATLNLTGLKKLENADLKLSNINKFIINDNKNLKKVDITSANSKATLDLTGCGTSANPVQIIGGDAFLGTITPNNEEEATYYDLVAASPVVSEWYGGETFGDNGSKYEYAYEKTVVRFTIKAGGDFAAFAAAMTDANLFNRARVIQFVTEGDAALTGADLAKLDIFGKVAETNLDFTYANVADETWYYAKYPDNPFVIFSPGAERSRTFYNKLIANWGDDTYKLSEIGSGFGNIYDSNEDGNLNTIEFYTPITSTSKDPVPIARRLLRLYNKVNEVIIHGNITGTENKPDDPRWMEKLCEQLKGITQIKHFTALAYNVNGNDIKIDNSNFTKINLSDLLGGKKVDLTKCTALENAVFVGATIKEVDARGLTNLKRFNFTNAVGNTVSKPSLYFDAQPGGKMVTIYGCNYIANHSTLPAHTCGGDFTLPYTMDPNTDMDITIDLDYGREWTMANGQNPQSLRELLKAIRADLSVNGNEYIKTANPEHRYNYVKIKGAIKPQNMGALNKYVRDGSFVVQPSNPLDITDKFDEGDIVCRYLDLSEARPIANELDGEGNEVPISWSALFNGGSTGGTVLSVNTAAVDYVILPPGLDKTTINAETFKGFTALKAAGSASEDGTKLVAYVKQPGTLYFLTAYMDVLNSKGYKEKSTDTDAVRTVCETGRTSDVGYNYWYFISGPDKLKELTLSGRINAFDLSARIATIGTEGVSVTYCLEDGHIATEKVHSVEYSTNAETVAAAEGQYGSKGALYGVSLLKLDLTDASFMDKDDKGNYINDYPEDFTLSALNCLTKDLSTSVDKVTVLIPKNTIELPRYFILNNKCIKEINLPNSLQKIRGYAFFSTNLTKVTCENEKGEIVDKSVDGKISLVLPSNLDLIETEAFGQLNTVKVTDVYIMARKAPVCQYNAFYAPMYYGWGGFAGNAAHPIQRANYNNNGDLFTILHYPEGLEPSEVMKYTDIDRKYSLQDEAGDTNGEGKLKMWPLMEEFYRSYAQALVGVTWNAWKEKETTTVTDPETGTETETETGRLITGGDGPLGYVKDYETDYYTESHEPTTWDAKYEYDYKNYIGWHQFVLADNYSYTSDFPSHEYTRFKKNVWYSVCFPYNMTKSQLLKCFGAKKQDGKEVTVNGEVIKQDVYPEVRTLIQVLRSEENQFITFMFSNDLVKEGKQIVLDKDGKGYKYADAITVTKVAGTAGADETEAPATIGEPIIIEGGKPYIIRPCYPDGEEVGHKPVAYASTFHVQLVNDNPYGTVWTDGKTVVPYTAHNVCAIDYDATTKDEIVYDKDYMYNFVGAYSSKHVIPQYSYFFGVPKDKLITNLYRDVTTGTTKRPWTQYTAIIGGLASARIDRGTTLDGEITSNVRLVFNCDNDDLENASGAKPFTYNFAFAGDEGNEPNAIENVTISEDGEIIGNGPIYNLNGIRINGNINSLQKGIYIMNGRKFVVK